MSRGLRNMPMSERRYTINRRLAQATALQRQNKPIGLGCLAAIDSLSPAFKYPEPKGRQ